MIEWWDLYNEQDEPLGSEIRRGRRLGKGRYHRVAEGWVRTPDGHYLLQRRSAKKKSYPLYWTASAVGAVLRGEAPEEAMIREIFEELGLKVRPEDLKLSLKITEHPAHYYIYKIEMDVKKEDIILDPEEVEDATFLTYETLCSWLREGKLLNLDYYRDFFKNWELERNRQ
ncbi:MAG: NUDIX domain-containing protein [Tissierellia bacterium]|nr:NUDIX domain-containing protein [Tissierellia bacterium]